MKFTTIYVGRKSMLSTHIHLAIEPVTTTFVVMGVLKMLGIAGAAGGGAVAGQVAAGNKKDPVKRGVEIAAHNFHVASGLNEIGSHDEKKS
jgi:hypothetical protein